MVNTITDNQRNHPSTLPLLHVSTFFTSLVGFSPNLAFPFTAGCSFLFLSEASSFSELIGTTLGGTSLAFLQQTSPFLQASLQLSPFLQASLQISSFLQVPFSFLQQPFSLVMGTLVTGFSSLFSSSGLDTYLVSVGAGSGYLTGTGVTVVLVSIQCVVFFSRLLFL